jgi:hypothetical protein
MVHFVKIQPNITDATQLYKKTEKNDGITTTTVFQRDASSQPKNIGEKILQKMTSPELWANPRQKPIFAQLEGMLEFILEQVKYIKKTFSIAHDKNSINIH